MAIFHRVRRPALSPPSIDRYRQPDLLNQLAIRHGAVKIAEHLFDEGRFLGVESAAEGRNDRLNIHPAKSALPAPEGRTVMTFLPIGRNVCPPRARGPHTN